MIIYFIINILVKQGFKRGLQRSEVSIAANLRGVNKVSKTQKGVDNEVF